jgi:hypothetical protein
MHGLSVVRQKKPSRSKSKRTFDMSRFEQRHIALKVAYYGHQYHGFAAQAGHADTVEHHLFEALRRTCLIAEDLNTQAGRCAAAPNCVCAARCCSLLPDPPTGCGAVPPQHGLPLLTLRPNGQGRLRPRCATSLNSPCSTLY